MAPPFVFHRLSLPDLSDYFIPGWTGTIPDPGFGIDWANNDPAGLLQAPVDLPAVPPNPYPGTYFVAGQEDATDAHVNRGMFMLAQNSDWLDQKIHRMVATPRYIEFVPSSGGTTGLTIPAISGVYLGSSNFPYPDLVSLVWSDDHSGILDPVGNRIVPATMTPNPGSAPPDRVNDFATVDVVITWSAPIIGDDVRRARVYYGARNAVGELGRGDLSRSIVFASEAISAQVQRLFQLLHTPLSLQPVAWNATWPTTMYDAAFAGLNATYRRSSTARDTDTSMAGWFDDWGVVTPTIDTAGSGGWIVRDGSSPTSYSAKWDKIHVDKLDACWRATMVDSAGFGGSTGFAAVGSYQSFDIPSTEGGAGLTGFLHTIRMRMSTGMWYNLDVNTQIYDAGNGTAQVVVGGPQPVGAELKLTLGPPDQRFWRNVGGDKKTSIVTGFDMIELKFANDVVRTYLIDALDPSDATVCYLRNLDGSRVTSFPGGGDPSVQYRWLTPTFYESDGASELQYQRYLDNGTISTYGTLPGAQMCGAGYIQPPILADSWPSQGPGDHVVARWPFGMWAPRDDRIAAWWGHRQVIINPVSGQTTMIPTGLLMGNGNVWTPEIFLNEIGHYNFLSTDPIFVHQDFSFDSAKTLSVDHIYTGVLEVRPPYSFLTILNSLILSDNVSWQPTAPGAGFNFSPAAGGNVDFFNGVAATFQGGASLRFQSGATLFGDYGSLFTTHGNIFIQADGGLFAKPAADIYLPEVTWSSVSSAIVWPAAIVSVLDSEYTVDLSNGGNRVNISTWSYAFDAANLHLKIINGKPFTEYLIFVNFMLPSVVGTKTVSVIVESPDAGANVVCSPGTLPMAYNSFTKSYCRSILRVFACPDPAGGPYDFGNVTYSCSWLSFHSLNWP